jgi:hypothetical protein
MSLRTLKKTKKKILKKNYYFWKIKCKKKIKKKLNRIRKKKLKLYKKKKFKKQTKIK